MRAAGGSEGVRVTLHTLLCARGLSWIGGVPATAPPNGDRMLLCVFRRCRLGLYGRAATNLHRWRLFSGKGMRYYRLSLFVK